MQAARLEPMYRGTLVGFVAVGIMALCASPAHAVPKLVGPDAKHYVGRAISLNHEDLGRWRYAQGKKVNCKRLSRVRMRCATSYYGGDLGFKGHVTIWYSQGRGQTFWNYAYSIKRTDYYCLNTGGSNCVKTFNKK